MSLSTFIKNKKILNGLLFLILLIVLISESKIDSDFSIFISASKDLIAKKDIYSIKYKEWYHYYYDGFFACLLIPLTFLHLAIGKFIWISFNTLLLFRIYKLIRKWLPFENTNSKIKQLFSFIILLFAIRFIRDNIHLGQITIFILYLIIEGLYQILFKNKLLGSLLLSLGITIKIMPLVFIPYLLYRSEWKSILYVLAGIIFILFLPGFFIGFEYNLELINSRLQLINPLNDEHILDNSERSFHSITTFLTVLLYPHCTDIHILPIKRNIADISIEHLNLIISIARLFFAMITLYFLNSLPFKKSNSKEQSFYEISYLLIAIPLIFPHQQHYAFLLILPGIYYCVRYFLLNYSNLSFVKKFIYCSSLILIFFIISSPFILGTFSEYYDHFKTLTYGTFILILVLAFSRPKVQIISN